MHQLGVNSISGSGAGFNYYFVIVGQSDNPIFELEYTTRGTSSGSDRVDKVDHRYLSQFIAHAALDLVDEYTASSPSMFIRSVDKFNEWFVVAFVGACCRTKYLLIHDASKTDETAIKNFFIEMYELYTKFALNPLYQHHTPIRSLLFDKKAQQIARKFLP